VGRVSRDKWDAKWIPRDVLLKFRSFPHWMGEVVFTMWEQASRMRMYCGRETGARNHKRYYMSLSVGSLD
jgi:hypothetical protein